MSTEFDKKVVIVTGSSSGIGEAAAVLFAKRGANVTLCGRDEARLQAAVEKCKQASGGGPGNEQKFISVRGDIREKNIREKILDDTVRQFGKIDVLVCNHGIVPKVFRISEETEETYDAVMDINLRAMYFLIQKAIPHLEKTKGNIVNISSIVSTMAAQIMAYAMTKAAIDHMTRCLAVQLGPKGIRVNTVRPTWVETRIPSLIGLDQATWEHLGSSHPLHGRTSTPEEQAEMIVFLASDKANFVTGVCVLVDGGFSLVGNVLPRDHY